MKYFINKIYLKNFKCIKDENGVLVNFDLDKGLVALSGPNGFGKTTIFDAIEICFCDNIERIVHINNAKKKLKDNLLIYKNRDKAIIAIELVSKEDNSIITIIKRIYKDDKNNEGAIKENINSFWINEGIDLDKIDIDDYGDKIENLKMFLQEKIGINNDYFNYFYYISQDNSSNFLKKGLGDRKSIFDVLMKIENEIDMNKKIKELLNNNKINSIDKLIDTKREKIKRDIKALFNVKNIDSDYQSNITIFEGNTNLEWDQKEYHIKDSKALNELIDLIGFMENYNVFMARKNNLKIVKLLDEKILKEFSILVILCNYDVELSYEENINTNIDKLEARKKICNKIKKLDEFSFENEEIIEDLKYINDKLELELKLDDISENIKSIISQNKQLDNKKKKIKELKESIDKLNKLFIDNIDEKEQNICPLCNSEFDSAEKLQIIIQSNIKELEKLIYIDNKQREKHIKDDLIKVAIECKEKLGVIEIEKYINNIDNQIKLLRIDYTKQSLKDYIDFYNNINEIDYIIREVKKDSENAADNLKKSLESKLIKEVKEYSREEYLLDDDLYNNYTLILDKKDVFDEKLDELLDRAKKKKKFFERELSLINSRERININNEVKKLIKMEELKSILENLSDIYKNTIKDYKKDVVSTIEIPLYIYTGKIIQTYQGGLGVFIKEDTNKDNILFTPNSNDSEHDIVNTFSSGQLSAFTIAFLLVINQLYLAGNESGNILNTILIDDPVQTMDDVNIASLIEVLRNQFSEYQMILSTHEDEKINYMRYKFEKFGIRTIEYNVKKNFFES